MNNRYIILAARLISVIFTPFYMPTLAIAVLLTFGRLNLLTPHEKLAVIFIVFLFTVFLPRTIIYFFRKRNGWSLDQINKRSNRYVPYISCISCYTLLLGVLRWLQFGDSSFVPIIVAALDIQIICAIINSWIKVSTHAAGSGGVIGMLMAFSIIYNFNAVGWLCLCILLCGGVCSARMVLRQHTYKELSIGVIVGFVCGWLAVLFF